MEDKVIIQSLKSEIKNKGKESLDTVIDWFCLH